jgi:class 3 adenylate cyclase
VVFNAFATTFRRPDYPWGQTREEWTTDVEGIIDRWGSAVELDWIAPSVAENEPFRAWWGAMQMRFASPRDVPAYFEVLAEIDARPALPLISSPTLVLHRPASFMQVENARYIAEHIPGSIYRELPGADGVAWLDGWEPLSAAIREFVTGTEPGETYESVLATVLFTDIVGSTEMVTRLGDHGWTDLIARYESVTARELERFGGTLVDRAGDGVFATFEGPARAIRCAVAMRERSREIGIETRGGVHIGELSRREGRVRGIAVHVGARIAGEARGGEILVSRTVRDLVAGSGLHLVDRGEHQLKGIAERLVLFAVAGD